MIRLATKAATALLIAAVAWPRVAHADLDAESPDAEPPDAASPDGAPPDGAPPDPAPTIAEPPPAAYAPLAPELVPLPTPALHFPQHFLFGNGLALVLTSLSVGYEFLPVAHHSIGVNIHGQYGGGIVSELVGVKGAFVGLGGELGYRFYAWRDGPFGPFLGFGGLVGVYHTQATFYQIDPNSFRYVQYGPVVDVGWSVHLDRTTVLALSLGAQYTFVTVSGARLNELTRLLVGDGPRPRAGIQVGKTF